MERQSKKYYGTAVQAILDTVFEKYCWGAYSREDWQEYL